MISIGTAELRPLLSEVCELALKAGEAIMSIYDGGHPELTWKLDNSPLTNADMLSHQIILAGLGRLTPEWPVLSEESQAIPFEQRRNWKSFWLVDPLDGTEEFLKRNGEFTVNIALVEACQPVLGVVHAPAMRTSYYAAQGIGSFKKVDGVERKIHVCRETSSPTRVVISRSHQTSETEAYSEQVGDCACIFKGSALKFCMVAEGAADVYPRSGPTMEWDTAAPQCILEQAGGSVADLKGNSFHYNKPSLMNPGFLASGA